ncbi:MAG: DUF3078 domain-containing protein [Flavobacteriales bacterium]|nr:DUF3078 domain-containing protein [Flavobacteriales bacterium]
MRKVIVIALLLIGSSTFAQVTDGEKELKTVRTDTVDGWKKGGLINFTFTQVSLTNWAAGGENSISLNGFSSLFANLKKGKSTWDNTLILAFGQVKQGGSKYVKSDDRLQFTSKYGRKASKDWYYAGLFDFQSQFTVGYSDAENRKGRISDFMAPGYFLGAIGMDYKPSDNFTVFISPVTAKLTVVNDDDLARVGAFGVQGDEFNNTNVKTEKFENTRLEIGGYLRMMYKREVMENVSFQTNLGLFSSYTDDPTHIDVNWDNIITMKVNKYINASFTTSLIYDHDILIQDNDGDVGPRTQFKYVLGIGFAYKFGDK